jgi:hypothetical protein
MNENGLIMAKYSIRCGIEDKRVLVKYYFWTS